VGTSEHDHAHTYGAPKLSLSLSGCKRSACCERWYSVVQLAGDGVFALLKGLRRSDLCWLFSVNCTFLFVMCFVAISRHSSTRPADDFDST
jgi:hypothetical protein